MSRAQSGTEGVILSAEQYKQGLSSQTAGEEMFGSIPEHGVGLSRLALRELASGRVIDSLQQGKPMQDVYLFIRTPPASLTSAALAAFFTCTPLAFSPYEL